MEVEVEVEIEEESKVEIEKPEAENNSKDSTVSFKNEEVSNSPEVNDFEIPCNYYLLKLNINIL